MGELVKKAAKRIKFSNEYKIKMVTEAIQSGCPGIVRLDDGTIVVRRSCRYKGCNIGFWVQTAKWGPVINEEFRSALEKLNINFNMLKNPISVERKLEIIKQAIENKVEGIKFNEDGTISIESNCTYMDFDIAKSLSNVKAGKTTNKQYIDGLRDLKVVISPTLTVSQKLYIINDAIENKVDGVSYDELDRVVFSDDCTHMGFNIGQAVRNIKRGTYTNLYFKKGLTKLNIALDVEHLVLSDEQKLQLIESAIKENIPGVLKTRDGQVVFKTLCKYKGFPVGSWVEIALIKKSKEKFLKRLLELNITDDRDLVNAILKADKIKEAIEVGAEGITKLPMINRVYINSTARYDSLEIGHMISAIMSGNCYNDELIAKVKEMNIIIDRREREVARRLIELMKEIESGKGVITLPNGKITISHINSNCGKLIKRVNEGLITNELFIQGLVGLNIDIDHRVLDGLNSHKVENKI
ncbi:MAG: hypothetical protein IKC49_00250 [Clostridia bacterium]|nr:hypothetical protein [Clostridia bacterium]